MPRAAVERLSTAVASLDSYDEERDDDPTLDEALDVGARRRSATAMDDDLNVSGGLGAVFELVRDLNRRVDARSLSTADAAARPRPRSATSTASSACSRCPRSCPEARSRCSTSAPRPETRRDWPTSDELRDELAAHGRRRRGHARRSALARDGARHQMADRDKPPRRSADERPRRGRTAPRRPPGPKPGPAAARAERRLRPSGGRPTGRPRERAVAHRDRIRGPTDCAAMAVRRAERPPEATDARPKGPPYAGLARTIGRVTRPPRPDDRPRCDASADRLVRRPAGRRACGGPNDRPMARDRRLSARDSATDRARRSDRPPGDDRLAAIDRAADRPPRRPYAIGRARSTAADSDDRPPAR